MITYKTLKADTSTKVTEVTDTGDGEQVANELLDIMGNNSLQDLFEKVEGVEKIERIREIAKMLLNFVGEK